ncbi:Cof-type HAD-IIB family hydrolase [bacterium]|nr:Cof-type HAD-IIB family hydrolase [bacterium]
MPKPRLIVIDIDGTLIDSQSYLRPDVEKAILRAIDEGVFVTLATGRMISAAREYIDRLKLRLPVIALNGAIIANSYGGKPLYHEPISIESSVKIVEAIWDTDSTLIFVCCDKAYARNVSELTGPALSTWIVNISNFEDIDLLGKKKPSTILVAGHRDSIEGIQSNTRALNLEDIEDHLFPSIRYFPMHYVEYRARGTNKGKALKMLREHLGVSRDEVLSIGDHINDISMAEESGIFAAPASAHQVTRDAADYVSPLSNDEGAVAQILDEFYFRIDQK